ncbi:MAG: cobyrinate a,c-diamide synthase [Clostridiales bacterium]|nr:cobyrinate a,c-diamide synthase [Clostridiales bacterium]MCF8022746.1 cobyrinate a,c-diamide synthase [Clostridiales bacterium]
MNIPRLVLAGTHSGAGKTTLTLGLLAALRKNGYKVQPYKVGPDYIDPGLHRVAAGAYSHNLDAWMGTGDIVKEVFYRNTRESAVAVVEGVMGLFDGVKNSDCGSTAHVSRLLRAPVVLVVNSRGMSRSCGALLKGYRDFDPRVNVAGVIFNNVGSAMHVKNLRDVAEGELGLPVLGAVKRRPGMTMPERHLGLLPAAEQGELDGIVEELALAVEEDVDLKSVYKLAQSAPDFEPGLCTEHSEQFSVNLAVARDEAFNFYYQDSLNYLQELGARLIYFSPLHDDSLPSNIHGIYLGGGFPEMFLTKLAQNNKMKDCLRRAHYSGIPLYAECGGLMYLMEELKDFEGKTYPGVGLVPGQVQMQNKLAALGYVRAFPRQESILASPGDEIKGHEFHYSQISVPGENSSAYQLYGGKGEDGRKEGYVDNNLLASYVHLHLRFNPAAANNFLHACAKRSK